MTTKRDGGETWMNDDMVRFVASRLAELERIPGARKELLDSLVRFVAESVCSDGEARLVFICTHNSRRSHMAQLWAQSAAAHCGVCGVETYSGGTEATAFNPRAVAAMRRAGFQIEGDSDRENPVYTVRWTEGLAPIEVFSKVFDQPPNPTEGFCAVMTCSSADAACPIVPGAASRVAIPYDDPKDFDGTGQETAMYDERCRDIAREMLYVFSRVVVDREEEGCGTGPQARP